MGRAARASPKTACLAQSRWRRPRRRKANQRKKRTPGCSGPSVHTPHMVLQIDCRMIILRTTCKCMPGSAVHCTVGPCSHGGSRHSSRLCCCPALHQGLLPIYTCALCTAHCQVLVLMQAWTLVSSALSTSAISDLEPFAFVNVYYTNSQAWLFWSLQEKQARRCRWICRGCLALEHAPCISRPSNGLWRCDHCPTHCLTHAHTSCRGSDGFVVVV